MKRLFSVLLVLTFVFSLTACGGNKKDIVGSWHIMDGETETEYGVGIEFTKDGKLRYGFTEDALTNLGDVDADEAQDALKGLEMLVSIEYKILSNTEMEIKTKALLGLASEKSTVSYSLDGDTLTFDGTTYTRVK